MPANITDTVVWTTPIQTVADGDAANATNFALSPQGLANRAAYLNANKMNVSGGSFSGAVTGSAITMTASVASLSITGGAIALTGSTPVTLSPRSVTRVDSMTFFPVNSSYWTSMPTGNQVTTSGSASGIFPIDPPHGSTITAVSAFTTPASGHGGLPAGMPYIMLWRDNAPALSGATMVSATDASATVSAYQASHVISASTSTVVDKTTYRYAIYVWSESGANALSGAYFPGVAYTVSLSALDQCAG